MEDELDKYLEMFVVANERGEAPVTTRTSERDLNVPVPVLPGYLGQYTAAPRTLRPGGTAKRGGSYTAPPRVVQAPMMLTTSATPTAKAAGGSPPPPSPAMSASPPSPPDAPLPPPPDAPPPPATNRIVTNYATAPAAPGCPPCSCPGEISTGSILALIAAAGAGWYLLTDRQ